MKHKDVEFHVDLGAQSKIYPTWDQAVGIAASISASTSESVDIDIVIYSRAGARSWGGDDAVETYDEDPDASVYDRITISAESHGRIR